jgi:hypothetical protein
MDVGALKNLGLSGKFVRSFGLDSATSDQQKVDTKWQRFEIGLRYRILTGAAGKAPLLGAGIHYASSTFEFSNPPGTALADQLPSATYKVLRVGVDGRVPFEPFALMFGVSYLPVLSVAPMGDRFPHESVAGVGADLGAAMRVAPWLEARLSTHYDRLFYKLHPEPGETYIAGGALDQYLSLNVGASAIF